MKLSRVYLYAASVSVLGGLALSGCSSESRNAANDSFWDPVRLVGVTEVVPPMSPLELSAEADSVVVGEITEHCEGRQIQGDAPEDVVHYRCEVLTIQKVLHGKDFGSSIELEFLGQSTEKAPLPDGQLVVFVTEKGPREPGKYRATNSYGIWAATGRSGLDQPLREHAPSAGEETSRDALAAASNVAELVTWLEGELGEGVR
ncbi:MAG: hypothetical protein QM713_14695 [Arachnia sp.]